MGEYAMVGAEIGKYCGATALTFNMHNSSMAWSRFMYDMPNLTPEEKAEFAPLRERQFRRAMKPRRRSIRSRSPKAGRTGRRSRTRPRPQGRWRLEDQRLQEVRLAGGLLRLLHHRLHRGVRREEPRHEDTMLFVVHKDTPGLTVKGDWDPWACAAPTAAT
jgi:alkylation response protein AidB-like acyl-CoA dehydrogenase